MDSSYERDGFDVPNCSKMSVEQKRELIYELSKESHVAFQLLQSWSRQEILEILCAEMGKERKHTGLTKLKLIETLLRIASEKRSGEQNQRRNCKRQRKTNNPSQFLVNSIDCSGNFFQESEFKFTNANKERYIKGAGDSTIYCNNTACRAVLRQEDKFCKRCSCCICHLYDDNKDPSLWLNCSSETPLADVSCGLSCHLDCAFKHEKSGLGTDIRNTILDGCFFCVACGKVNDLLGCWRKQLIVAKDTRRVDVLCYRLSLARKLLEGTKKYRNLFDVVDEGVKKLEAEVGPLIPVKMARGIVNRLQSGPEVQKLCSSALESLESLLLSDHIPEVSVESNSSKIRFEDARGSSLTAVLGSDESSEGRILHYSLWHRKVTDKDYPERSTCTLYTPNTRFVVSGLTPATEYSFKVVTFSGTIELSREEVKIWTGKAEDEAVERSESPATNCSSLSNPSSVEDESNNYVFDHKLTRKQIVSQNVPIVASGLNEEKVKKMAGVDFDSVEKNLFLENQIIKEIVSGNGFDSPLQNNCLVAGLPATPHRPEKIKNDPARTAKSKDDSPRNLGKNIENAVDTKKNGGNGLEKVDSIDKNGGSDCDFEGCVKVIRQLECLGHIDKNFRQNFLTWYSLRATVREIRVVKVFIDAFSDDPTALAEQLVDTFMESVSCKRSTAAVGPPGLCLKLWH